MKAFVCLILALLLTACGSGGNGSAVEVETSKPETVEPEVIEPTEPEIVEPTTDPEIVPPEPSLEYMQITYAWLCYYAVCYSGSELETFENIEASSDSFVQLSDALYDDLVTYNESLNAGWSSCTGACGDFYNPPVKVTLDDNAFSSALLAVPVVTMSEQTLDITSDSTFFDVTVTVDIDFDNVPKSGVYFNEPCPGNQCWIYPLPSVNDIDLNYSLSQTANNGLQLEVRVSTGQAIGVYEELIELYFYYDDNRNLPLNDGKPYVIPVTVTVDPIGIDVDDFSSPSVTNNLQDDQPYKALTFELPIDGIEFDASLIDVSYSQNGLADVHYETGTPGHMSFQLVFKNDFELGEGRYQDQVTVRLCDSVECLWFDEETIEVEYHVTNDTVQGYEAVNIVSEYLFQSDSPVKFTLNDDSELAYFVNDNALTRLSLNSGLTAELSLFDVNSIKWASGDTVWLTDTNDVIQQVEFNTLPFASSFPELDSQLSFVVLNDYLYFTEGETLERFNTLTREMNSYAFDSGSIGDATVVLGNDNSALYAQLASGVMHLGLDDEFGEHKSFTFPNSLDGSIVYIDAQRLISTTGSAYMYSGDYLSYNSALTDALAVDAETEGYYFDLDFVLDSSYQGVLQEYEPNVYLWNGLPEWPLSHRVSFIDESDTSAVKARYTLSNEVLWDGVEGWQPIKLFSPEEVDYFYILTQSLTDETRYRLLKIEKAY
jgi:hypothetical protein